MKKAIIIHGWGGNPESCWLPWAKKELEARELEVSIPSFSRTDNPSMHDWLSILQKVVGNPDEDLYLIGHSLGCITIMRYLETLKENQKIGGAIFVAGFHESLDIPEIESFFQTPMNLEKIKDKTKNGFVAIHSDNDQYVDLKFADAFKEKLGAEIIIKHNANHFSGTKGEEGYWGKLPDVVESIEKLINK